MTAPALTSRRRAAWLSVRMGWFRLRHSKHPGFRQVETGDLLGAVCFADGSGLGIVAGGDRGWVIARGKAFVTASVDAATGPWNPR